MKAMPEKQAKKLIENLGMHSSILEKPMNALSGGQRQLIAFTMATQLIPKS
jgi:ABC-type dipeptide/oligopeptide/nickel transport system ATPase subunit